MSTISQRSMGYRVSSAREASGMTQEALAKSLGLKDRQSVSDIETGKRSLKPEELMILAELFNRDIEFFIDPFVVAGEAQFSWRVDPAVTQASLDDFEDKAGQWIGLMRWMRELTEMPSDGGLKLSLQLTKNSTYEIAQDRAEAFVSKFELGQAPAERLIETVERDLDIPVLFVDTIEAGAGKSISGATCHLEDMRVILINRNENEARRHYDLAHELFHALTWDTMKPDHRESNSHLERSRGKRIEELANNFAASLLMPISSIAELLEEKKLDDVAHLVDVAARLRVAPSAFGWRLLNLGLIGQTTCTQLTKERQKTHSQPKPKKFSSAFAKMLHDCLDHGKLSARKAAKVTGLGLAGLQELFQEYELPPAFDL